MPSLSPDFWTNEKTLLAQLIRPHLERMAVAGALEAEKKLTRFEIGFDNALVHADALAWAQRYTDDLLAQLGTTSERVVGQALAGFIDTPGATIGALEEQLKQLLDTNDARAWTIAVTETTRAYAQGNAIAYQRAGIPRLLFNNPAHPNCRCTTGIRRLPEGDLAVVWYTNQDELVCRHMINTGTSLGVVEGCRALHGVIISEGKYFGRKWNEA
jgi:hypothetical protein